MERIDAGVPSRYRLFFLLGAACLLAILTAELLLSLRQMSLTLDESAHLYAGYQHWRARDFGVNPEHPPLVKMVAALPLLGMNLKQPHPPNPFFIVEEYAGGGELMQANDMNLLLTRGRTAVCVFTLLLGVLVFAMGYEMFGPQTALLALALFTFEPMVLAHGALVTTDMGLAACLCAAVYAFYRYVKQPGAARLLAFGVTVGLTLVTKLSGVLILPIVLVCAAAELIPVWSTSRALRLAGAICAGAAIGYAILWGFYGFRYAARPSGLVMVPALAQFVHMMPGKTQTWAVVHLAQWHLLPEAYLYGWTKLPAGVTHVPGFLFGRLYDRGSWMYFPAALLIKSSLTLLLLTLVAPTLFWRGLLPYRRELVFLGAGILVYLGASMTSDLNIGVRYVLPVYPFAAVLAGTCAWAIAKSSKVAMYAVAALLLFQMVSSLRTYPNYIPYANEAFGGPDKSYRYLADSNVDWAQTLKQVSAYLVAHQITECWIAHSGLSDDLAAAGVPCKPLPTGLALMAGAPQAVIPTHISGVVLVGAQDASGVLWGEGDLNPYRQFQEGTPETMVASAVLVYRGSYDVTLASAQSHVSQIPVLLQQGLAERAVEEAQTAVGLVPASARLKAQLGGTLKKVHRDPEANDAFAEAMQLAKTHRPNDQSKQIAKLITGLQQPAF
jgi:4-amino-4-deoxy-L-arabinose transferase-like glycosyltransferase